MKRSPLRKVSAKKRAELAETDDLRHWYIRAGYTCQICRDVPATECHEITAGAHRHMAVRDPDAQLYVCRDCHDFLQGKPYEVQLAIRLGAIMDAINYCHGSLAVSVRKMAIAVLENILD